jgi:hypothetical protein
MISTPWVELGSKQAMASSYIAPEHLEKETTTIDDSVSEEDCNKWDDYMILSRYSTVLIRAAQAARAGEEPARIIKNRSVAIVDCGATDSDMLPSSLINATDVEES